MFYVRRSGGFCSSLFVLDTKKLMRLEFRGCRDHSWKWEVGIAWLGVSLWEMRGELKFEAREVVVRELGRVGFDGVVL